MGSYYDLRTEEEWQWEDPVIEVETTPNPIVSVLYGPDGKPLRSWAARPPIGFR